MSLPVLPLENEDPWFVHRDAFDQAVKAALEGRLSGSSVVVLGEADPDPASPVDGVLYVRLGDAPPSTTTTTTTVSGTTTTTTTAGGTTTTTTTAAVPTMLWQDTFTADAAGWANLTGGSTPTATSGELQYGTGWSAYSLCANAGNRRDVSARAVFSAAAGTFQGIFVARHSSTNGGVKFFNNSGTWVVGNSEGFASDNTPVTTPVPEGSTAFRLDLIGGTTVRAYAGVGTADTLVLEDSISDLTLTPYISSDAAETYLVGYCGESKTPYITTFEVWST